MKPLCGVDIVHIPRFEGTIKRYGSPTLENDFINRVFNPEEISHILERQNPYEGLAGRFAAKEAVIKALNSIKKIADLKSIQVLGEIPYIKINDKELTHLNLSVSISHDGDYAVATVFLII